MRSLQILGLSIFSLLLVVSGAPAPESEPHLVKRASRRAYHPQGFDVSKDDGTIDFGKITTSVVLINTPFMYIKATEGTS